MNQPRRPPRFCEFITDAFERREGEIVQRNGNLTEVRDRETGDTHHVAPHEIEREW